MSDTRRVVLWFVGVLLCVSAHLVLIIGYELGWLACGAMLGALVCAVKLMRSDVGANNGVSQ